MRRLTLMVATFSLIVVALPAQAAPGVQLHPVVVQLADDHPNPAEFAGAVVGQHGGRAGFIYEHAIRGFSAQLPQAAIEALERNPQVVAISPDEVVVSIGAADLDIPTGYDRIEADLVGRTSSTTDVDIAILDTGVRLYHPDLNVYRASDCTSSLFGDCLAQGILDDDHGHGSHVAGTAAALDNGVGTTGVASGARIWSLKVLDSSGNGLLSSILGGVDAVTEFSGDIEVANMSLAGEFSNQTFDDAIANSIDAGVFYAVAAGNSGTDAATFSPANHPDVMAVSAVADGDGSGGGLGAFGCRGGETDDTLASFSNYGSVVDIAAPGVCIYSTWNDNSYRMASGTSMAAPHVAGAAALYIAETGRDQDGNGIIDGNDVAAVRQALLSNAIPQGDACGFSGDSDGYAEPLLSLNTGLLGSGGCAMATPDATGPTPPVVTSTADGFNIDVSWTASSDPESGVLSYLLTRDGIQIAELDAHVTSFRDAGLSPATNHDYTVAPKNRQGLVGSDGGDSATTSSDDPTQIGHFGFDAGSGSTAADSSGWRRHGTLRNGPVWTQGVDGGSLQFDGSDDRVDLDPATLNGADDVTAAFWIRTEDTGGQALISGANSGNSNEYLIYLVNDTRLRLYVGTGETEGVEWQIPSIADGQWHHVTVVRNSGPEQAYLYLEGNYYGGWQVTKAMDPLQIAGALLGQDQDSVGGGFDPNQALAGELDDLQLFDRVLSDAEIAALAQTSPNTAPAANADVSTTDEDNSVVIDVLGNDTDADGDALAVDSTTSPGNGSATLNSDNTITYTPATDFNGADSFEYTVSDGNGGFDTATVSVTVDPVNDAPLADAGLDQSVVTGAAVTLDGSGSSDVEGDALAYSWSITSAPGSSSAQLDDPNAVSPSFTTDIEGSYVVELVVNDGAANSTPDSVTVTATDPINTPPVGVGDGSVTDEDSPVVVDVLSNDTDADGDVLAVDSVSQPTNGSASLNPDNTITYTPDADFNGADSFDYTVSDGNGGSDTATVDVTVNPVNDAPVAVDDAASTDEDTSVALGVLANDSDVEGSPLTVTNLTQPTNGSVVASADGTVTYTPDPDFNGSDSFTYTAYDGSVNSTAATVAVTVSPVNDDPVAADDSVSTTEDNPVIIDVLGNDGDPEGDSLTVVSVGPAGNGTVEINADSTVTYTPDTGFSGLDVFTYSIEDGNGGSDTASVGVAVESDVSIIQYSQSEMTVVGSRTGDLGDTYVADGVYEELTETHQGGPPRRRVSELEHRWTFDIQSGDSVTLTALAYRSDPSEDDLVFEYSVDGGASFQRLFTVASTTPMSYESDLTASASGQLIVRVIDTDRTAGNGDTDSVFVDLLTIETLNPQASTGDDYEFRALSESVAFGSITSGDYTSTHQAGDEYEQISEEEYAGGKKTRLEHTWMFNASEPVVSFNISATAVGAESFTFAYSTDGSNWSDMTLSLGGGPETHLLPTLSGTIYVRVTDDDGSRGDSEIDHVQVDEMYFSTSS
jgi:subtilisin family serine protease